MPYDIRVPNAPSPSPSKPAAYGAIPHAFLYRIPVGFFRIVTEWHLRPEALRLLHAFVHATYRDSHSWTDGGVSLPDGLYARSCRELKDLIGPAASNDNRALRTGVDVLSATGLFEHLGFLHDGRAIAWQFATNTLAWLFADERYGLYDIRAIGTLRDTLPIRLHTEIGIVRRMDRPEVDLSVANLCADLDPESVPSWSRLRRPFVRSLQAIARRETMRFIVILRWCYELPGIDTVTLRVEHMSSKWHHTAITKRPGQIRKVLILDAGSVTEVSPDMLPETLACVRLSTKS